jgi:hypothetical protein
MYKCTIDKDRFQRNDRPAPSSDGAPHDTKDRNSQTYAKVESDEPQKRLDTKTAWLTDRQLQSDQLLCPSHWTWTRELLYEYYGTGPKPGHGLSIARHPQLTLPTVPVVWLFMKCHKGPFLSPDIQL